MEQSEQCCGFGGTFSVKFPEISVAMGIDKLENIMKTGAEYVVANDTSCLLHLEGLLKKKNLPLKTIHLADLLGQSV
jgi:L-lactate dehydrogenase complex protein LldE